MMLKHTINWGVKHPWSQVGMKTSHRVVCAQSFHLRTQQKLENHYSETRAWKALESSGLPHMTTVARIGAGLTLKVTQGRGGRDGTGNQLN